MVIDYKAGQNTQFNNKLRNIDYITTDVQGNLYVKYSDLPDKFFKLTYDLKWLEEIKLENQNDITQRQNFIAIYKNGNKESVSNYINTILAIEMQGDNIIALYSDPEYRTAFENRQDTVLNKDYFKLSWTDPVTGVFYPSLTWINLTFSKGAYHIQGEYTYSDLKGDTSAQDFSIDLSNGFGGAGLDARMGWLVTVQDGSTKRIYAFDYNDFDLEGIHTFPDGTKTHWYEIFSLAVNEIDPKWSIMIAPLEEEASVKTNLNEDGLWFVTYPGHDNI